MHDESQGTNQVANKVRVQQLIAQWEGLLDQGQYVPAEELCADCPELIEELQQLIDSQRETDRSPGGGDAEEGESDAVGVMATVVEANPERKDQFGIGALVLSQKYRKLTFLAKGGLGEVYAADDEDLRREVAIKFIKQRYKNRSDCTEQFKLEAEITSRLDHPGVVPVYGYGKSADGRLCYAMRLIQGETLEERIARLHAPTKKNISTFSMERSVEFRGVLAQFIAVCNTIAYAHNRGILHRDIKPENIMLGKYDDTLVVDWGLAMTVDRDETAKASGERTLMPNSGSGTSSSGSSGGPVGTPAYMSPEQAKGEGTLTAATDIFALGCTLYKILTGRAPYTGDNARETLTKARYGTYQPPQSLKSDVPAPLAAICSMAMEVNPDDRYFTAIELAYDLERYLAGGTVVAYSENVFERFRRWRRLNSTLWHSMISIVLLLAVGLTVGLTSTYNQRQNLVRQRLEHLQAEGHFYNHVILSDFDELRKDVLLLGGRPTVINAALQFEQGELPDKLATDLDSLFREFLAQNPSYVQLRYIANDADGMEKLRIDRSLTNPNNLVAVPGSPKGDRGYFSDTVRLQRNQVYLSGIDINMEQGIHQWSLPVVRAGIPVFDPDKGRVLGIVMINMAFDAIMGDVQPRQILDDEDSNDENPFDNARVLLADENGNFLRFPGVSEIEFCFERGLEYPMESLFEELANFRKLEHEKQWTSITPMVSALVAAHEPGPEPDTNLTSKLKQLVRDESFQMLRVEESSYSEQDRTALSGNDARAMAILKGNGDTSESDLITRLTSDLGPAYSVTPLPGLAPGRKHALYARKLFFDATDKKRFLCLLVVLPYN